MKTNRIKIYEMMFSMLFFVIIITASLNVNATELPRMSAVEIETEATPEVENWMIDNNIWNINNNANSFMVEQEMDPELKVEPWMFDEKYFVKSSLEIPLVEIEEPVKLEGWMLNKIYWNIK